MMTNIEIIYVKGTVRETMDRLEKLLRAKQITVYARIDQRKEAAKAGIELSPLEFMLFGNPKAGGALMSLNPFIALDLPLKAIACQYTTGITAVAYNSRKFLEHRYKLEKEQAGTIDLAELISQLLGPEMDF